ncbi:MAG TPA: hypothetical protein VFO10_27460 [Oligoflexus sp.]|uniref:hypothetical protein n=1 Tax=Oligoflexus sp. TaxID=1971216 RepID=UPI002D7F6A7E|nr:hypothetical protein [Oligoflexus sp.]HET9241035.1 hypothetical protein [Oligoflexus sp.]
MRRKQIRKPLSLLLLASFTATSSQVYALPSYTGATNSALKLTQAQAIQRNPTLAGTTLFQDHLDSKILYVSPSTKKTQSGVYSPVNGAVNCPVLENQFALTYRLPASSEFEAKAAAGAYSPYFDLQYGNYYRFGNLINSLATKMASAELLKAKPEYAAFKIAEEKLKLKDNEIDEVKSQLASLDTAVTTAATLLSVSPADQIIAAREALQQAVASRQEKSPGLLTRKAQLEAERIPLQNEYFTAKQAWLPYDADLVRLAEAIDQTQTAMAVVDKVATEVFGRNEKTLQAFETKVIGLASASYSIWGTEAADMQSALAQLPSYSGRNFGVRQLPIFNVTLASTVNPASHKAGSTVSSDSPTIDKVTEPKNTLFRIAGAKFGGVLPGIAAPSDNWVFKTKAGIPLRPIETKPSAAAGTFQADINQGVYCMGSSDRGTPSSVGSFLPIGGIRKAWAIDSYSYKPRSQRVMAQSVALNYDYHVKADPMRVSCTLDVSKSMDYVRNSGEWNFLWWGEKWDDTRRTSSGFNGVTCKTDENPSDASPNSGDAQARLDALRNKAINEITAEFLMTYAKSWRTEVVEAPQNIPDRTKFFSSLGTGLESICGPNVYCKVTSVVMKSLDEIAGSRSGSTSHHEDFSAVITRNYNEQSFRTLKGNANIDLTVDAP